jgi:hypothetical protein
MANSPVYITLGNGKDIGIDGYGELRIVNRNAPKGSQVTSLGMATKQRIEDLKGYLDRLSIHAVDA